MNMRDLFSYWASGRLFCFALKWCLQNLTRGKHCTVNLSNVTNRFSLIGEGSNDPHPARFQFAIWGISLRCALASLRGLNDWFIAHRRVIFNTYICIYIFILFSYFLQGPWGAGAFLPGSIWGDHIPTNWEKSLAVPVQIRTLETAQFYSELGPLRLLLRLLRFLNAFKVLPKDLQHTAFTGYTHMASYWFQRLPKHFELFSWVKFLFLLKGGQISASWWDASHDTQDWKYWN